jgi:hypothetical protein
MLVCVGINVGIVVWEGEWGEVITADTQRGFNQKVRHAKACQAVLPTLVLQVQVSDTTMLLRNLEQVTKKS